MVNLIIPRVLTKATSTTPFYNELLLSVRSSNYSTLFSHIHNIWSNGRPPLRRTELRNHSSWCQDWQLSDFITIICMTKLKLKCLKNTCKHHRTKSQIPYYSNSIATFQLWLRAGDISENPGPTVKSEWTHPCTKALVCLQCNKCVQRNQKHLFCIKWMDLTHTHCAGVGNTKHLISSLPNEWICSKYLISASPYYSLNILDISETFSDDTEAIENLHLNTLKNNSKNSRVMHISTQWRDYIQQPAVNCQPLPP